MKDYDQALELYEQAGAENPVDQRYELAARRMRFVAGQAHVDRGHRLRRQGQLEEALTEFQRRWRLIRPRVLPRRRVSAPSR